MDDQLRRERLKAFERAWMDVDLHYDEDIQAAAGDKALIRKIDSNWSLQQKNWADAAVAALGENNDALEAAHKKAEAANDQVEKARKAAAHIAEVVRECAQAAGALSDELDIASKV